MGICDKIRVGASLGIFAASAGGFGRVWGKAANIVRK
jgi:hypothetical protein